MKRFAVRNSAAFGRVHEKLCNHYYDSEVDCRQRALDQLRREAAKELQQQAARKKRKWKSLLKQFLFSPFGE
jgi:hypothetical protein